jgi:photosystem II stability/assembly factor-like uncharacterized protein
MKKIYSVFLLLVLLSFPLYSQTWTIQQSNTIQTLWSVHFINSTTGIICGEGGTILKTTNSGTNWISKNSGTTKNLQGARFINSTTGFASGWQGPILKTTDAGESWNIISFNNLPSTSYLGGGWFFDANNAVIAMGTSSYKQSKILKTTNGCASWDTVFYPPPSTQGWISYFHFPDSQNGYATVGYDTVYKTVNGGLNWTIVPLGGYPQLWTSGVYFFDALTGFVGGGNYSNMTGQLSKTTNGGTSWQIITSAYGIAKIQFCDNSNGYALAASSTSGYGIIIKTTDGGGNWNIFSTPRDSLNGMHFLSTTLGYASGVQGRILRYGFQIGIKTISSEVPDKFYLYQNYPNPFNPTTNIKYQITNNGYVTLKVFDINGKEISTLINEKQTAGTYEATFDASALSSGIYFYRIIAGDYVKTMKMILLK